MFALRKALVEGDERKVEWEKAFGITDLQKNECTLHAIDTKPSEPQENVLRPLGRSKRMHSCGVLTTRTGHQGNASH